MPTPYKLSDQEKNDELHACMRELPALNVFNVLRWLELEESDNKKAGD